LVQNWDLIFLRKDKMSEEKKVYGYNGKILRVDLSKGETQIEENGEDFYRTYLGGGLLGTYYVYKEMVRGIDPLSEKNMLVFAPSVMTGAPVTGVSRFNVSAKSPLTGGIGDTQCGGGWGPKLKHSGFDAIIIKGKATHPVFLYIDSGKVEIRDASHLWGKVTGEAQRLIYDELGDDQIEVAQIGPAGENLVKFGCITGGLSHFAGRTGMGAVMGSKNLKAIAVKGKRLYPFFNEEGVKTMAKKGAEYFQTSEGHQLFHKQGTALGVMINKEIGNIMNRNFRSGHFNRVDEISGKKMAETILKGTDTCWACSVRCKRVVELKNPYVVDPLYGGPEFETIIMLGSNLGIDSLPLIAKASEICNKFGIDTITAGGMISFAMECFEKEIISEKDTSGLPVKFGNGEVVLKLLEMIAKREGIGDLLAEGPQKTVSLWGDRSREFAIHTKNQIFPAHLPQVKQSQALIYAVNPFGPDHMSSEHDWISVKDGDIARGLGITDFTDYNNFDEIKIKGTMFSQFYYSLLDVLTLCDFCWGPGTLFSYLDLEEFISYVTGWQMSFWELMKAGERRINLMRAFNAREGFNRSHDTLPKRIFQPLSGGISDGRKVDENEFHRRLTEYYEMMNWDKEDGNPTRGKLIELGLGWIAKDLRN
jgi:aldehyde:ferredoxin oxidoreductase